METLGRGRPEAGIGAWVGVIERDEPRIAESGEPVSRRRTVVLPVRARKATADPRPRRRSRVRTDGRGKLAAGRAAYFAAML